MTSLLKTISFLGLVLNIAPAIMVFNDLLSFKHYTILMLIGTILWFATAPFWINKNRQKGF